MTEPKKRGGPRLGFGGKQPGAGRPAQPVRDKPVKINLEPDIARRLDAIRGETSRSAFIRLLIDASFSALP